MRYLLYVIPIALAIYALIDLSRSRVEERSGLHAFVWVVFIVLLPVLGPVAWIVLSRTRRAELGGSPARPSRPSSGPRSPRRRGPVAPDDDPEFLWRLEQERRRRRRQAGGAEPGDVMEPDGDVLDPGGDLLDPDGDDRPDGQHGDDGSGVDVSEDADDTDPPSRGGG